MSKVTGNYNDYLREHILNDEELAALYLSEPLDDFFENNDLSQQLLLDCLSDVLESHLIIKDLVKTSGLSNKALRKLVSSESSPRLSDLYTLFKELEFCVHYGEASKEPLEITIREIAPEEVKQAQLANGYCPA